MNKFAQRLKNCLEQHGVSQTKLAQMLNIKQQSVSDWVLGNKETGFDMLLKICKILNVSPNYMLGWDE